MSEPRTGAQAFCDALQRAGVECVFGLPGTQTVDIYDALRASPIRAVVPTHELAAAFMANGYARAARKPGVLLTISGPGVAFAPAGLAEAKLDAVPLVHFTIAPAAGPTGEPSFQAFDQAALARPVVKATLRANHRSQIVHVVQEALALAAAPEAGPVFVEIAMQALRDRGTDAPPSVSPAPTRAPDDERGIESIVDAVAAARYPVVFVACDCVDVAEALASTASTCRMPVLVPAPHRGVVPEDNAWTLCCDDQRTAFPAIQAALDAADLVVVLGTRLSHVATAGFRLALARERTVCVSDTGASLPHGYSAHLTVKCSPARFLEKLSQASTRLSSNWSAEEVLDWQRRFSSEGPTDPPEPRVDDGDPAAFFDAVRFALPRDSVLATDSGLHQVLVRRHYSVLGPTGLMFPSDFQSMGFGLAAAIGAKIASPKRDVVTVMGDGGFMMSGLELATAAREGIPIVLIVFNDGQLNLIRLHQIREFGHPHAVELYVPDLARFAESVGVRYRTASGDWSRQIAEALIAPEPTLIEVKVGDSRPITGMRIRSLTRETVRQAVGPRALSWLKGRFR